MEIIVNGLQTNNVTNLIDVAVNECVNGYLFGLKMFAWVIFGVTLIKIIVEIVRAKIGD